MTCHFGGPSYFFEFALLEKLSVTYFLCLFDLGGLDQMCFALVRSAGMCISMVYNHGYIHLFLKFLYMSRLLRLAYNFVA